MLLAGLPRDLDDGRASSSLSSCSCNNKGAELVFMPRGHVKYSIDPHKTLLFLDTKSGYTG